jgi:hypothetical protein
MVRYILGAKEKNAYRRTLMNRMRWIGRLLAIAVFYRPPTQTNAQEVDDYHQHLLSPVVAGLVKAPTPFAAADLIPLLDAAGIRRAVVLSLAYQFGNQTER